MNVFIRFKGTTEWWNLDQFKKGDKLTISVGPQSPCEEPPICFNAEIIDVDAPSKSITIGVNPDARIF
uniref:Uncharacterized protein n=1 Tax=viral metagenome TaxID=1070528 RepID=A0A6M3IVT8_9ZZZZ